MTTIELWLLGGGMAIFFILMFVIQWMEHKITRLQSHIRSIRCQLEVTLENIGPLGVDDQPDLDRIREIAFDPRLVSDL